MSRASSTIIKDNWDRSIEALLALPRSARYQTRVACPPGNDLTRDLYVASETRANPRVWPGEEPRRGLIETPAKPHFNPDIDEDEALDEEPAVMQRTLSILDPVDTRALHGTSSGMSAVSYPGPGFLSTL